MNIIKKNWHENVMTAFSLLREAVVDADDGIRKAGAHELSSGDKENARKAMSYSDKIDVILSEVEKLGDAWQGIHDDIENDIPAVQEIVLPTTVRNCKDRKGRKVSEVKPWTNFTVLFGDGVTVSESTAKETFAKAIQRFDLQKVADMGFVLNGLPLISKDRNVFSKYKQSIVALKNGWYISPSSSTESKAKYIMGIAERLGVKVVVKIVPHSMTDRKPPEDERGKSKERDCKGKVAMALKGDGRMVDGLPYKVGQIARVCFPLLFSRGLLTQKEIRFLQQKESSRVFQTGGYAVIMVNRGVDSDRYRTTPKGLSIVRYYPEQKVSLSYKGQKYYLTCQFMPEGLPRVVKMLEEKGISKAMIRDLMEQSEKNKKGPMLPMWE